MPAKPKTTKTKTKKSRLSNVPNRRLDHQVKEPDAGRARAAVEVLQAVWLNEQHFDLEHKVSNPPLVREDSEGQLWVTVELHVPALDVDAWLDGTHVDDPDNQRDGERAMPKSSRTAAATYSPAWCICRFCGQSAPQSEMVKYGTRHYCRRHGL